MKIAKPIVISLIAILVLFSMVEAGYRLLKGRVPQGSAVADEFCVPDKVLGYRFRPGAVAPQGKSVNCINNVGFRGEDVTIPKPLNVFRILCVGDSATNGVNVHNAETYPGILGEMFKRTTFKNNIRVEVVNAGVPGYLSDHHRYLLQRKYLELQPDLVVFMMGVTDVSSVLLTNGTWDAIRNITRDYKFLPKTLEEFFQRNSSAYYYGSRQLLDYRDRIRLEKGEKKDLSKEIEEALAIYADNYQTMIDICHKEGVGVLNINFPWKFTSKVGREDNYSDLKNEIKYYEFNLYWQAMPLLSKINQNLAINNDIINVDVQPDVLKAKDRLSFYGKNDFSHPSVNGNFLIASRVYQVVIDRFFKNDILSKCDGLELANTFLLGLDPDR